MNVDKGLCSVVGMTALLCLIWAIWLGHPQFTLDDAYIYQHAADALTLGKETRFPRAGVLSGVTSVLYLMLIHLFGVLLSAAWAQLFLVAASLLLYVAGIYCLARKLGAHTGLCVLLAFTAAITSNTLVQFGNGLETGLAMAVMTWCLLLFHDQPPTKPWAYLLLGVMPLLRPELGVLSLVLLLRALSALRHDKQAALLALLMPALVVAVVGAFAWLHDGSLLPATVKAKQYFFAEGCMPALWRLDRVRFALWFFCLDIGPLVLGVIGLVRSPLRAVVVLFVLAFLYAYFLQFPSGLVHNFHRYMYVLIPLVFLGWANVLGIASKPLRKVFVVVLFVGVAFAAGGLVEQLKRYQDSLNATEQALSVARWVADNVPAEDTVLIHDAGAISMYGASPLVDLVGLKTPWSIEVNRVLRWQFCGANKPLAIGVIAKAASAKYLVVVRDWNAIFQLTASLEATGWKVTRVDGARGDTLYSVYRISQIE